MIQEKLLGALGQIAQLQTAANTSKQVKAQEAQDTMKSQYLAAHGEYMKKKDELYPKARGENESEADYAKRMKERDSYTWSKHLEGLPSDKREAINQWEFSTNTINYSKIADEMQKRAQDHLQGSIIEALNSVRRNPLGGR